MTDEGERIDLGGGPELDLVQTCMRVQAGIASTSDVVDYAGRVDHHKLIRLATQHRLIPVVYFVLEQVRSRIPEVVFAPVQDVGLQYAGKSTRWLSELEHIHRRLTSGNIPAITMRGPILSWRLYKELGLRQFSDLDLLVRAEDAQKATAILVDEGYEAQFQFDDVQERAYIHFRTERFFIKSRQRLCVDVHWQLLPDCLSFDGSPHTPWKRAEKRMIDGYEYPVLAEEDLVYFMCAHGAKHGWDQLALVLDLGCVLRGKSEDQLRTWHAAAYTMGKGRIVALGYALAGDILGLPMPADLWRDDPVVLELVARIGAGYAEGIRVGDRGGREKGIMWRVLERPVDRFRYIRELVFLPSGIELGWVSLPRPLYFVYYLLRALRLAVKHAIT